MERLQISRGENDRLFHSDGRVWIDLFSGHGTTWLGHANPAIVGELVGQVERLWITGGLASAAQEEAAQLVESFFPESHYLAALYSTGMEAAEFAIRVVRQVTRRNGVVGFERSLHGKSLATAFLGWDNRDGVNLPGFVRLPFVSQCSETEIVSRLARTLSTGEISAVFVEPVQASGGGHRASPGFYRELGRLCSASGALLIFDEILTGFYRTGSPFLFSAAGVLPDVILIGKALGNGFPVSGAVINRRYTVTPSMLPGSTFSGNALAAAAVAATLRQMRSLDLPSKVAAIERTILARLAALREGNAILRGQGALWVVELPAGVDLEQLVVAIYRRGVAIGFTERQIRILPPATIDLDRLASACSIVRDEVQKACHG